MGWLGKILGGSLGYLVGGPIGAVAGAALGHGFDAAADLQRSGTGSAAEPLTAHESQQAAFFVSTFSMLGKLAKADGVVSREEVAAVEAFMRNNLGLPPQARRLAIRIFDEAKSSPVEFEDYARQFYGLFHGRPEMLYSMVELLTTVALADGVFHPEEQRLIAAAAEIFGVEYEQVRRARTDDADRYYAVLGASREDSMTEIKKKYRALAQEYHPDRIISKGLPEEFVKFANQKFQEIQEAYEKIKAERGA